MPPGNSSDKTGPMDQQTAKDIGEIKGLLQGISDRLVAQDVALNRRMDDQHQANTRRLDDLTRTVSQRIDGQELRLTRVEDVASRADAAAKTANDAIAELKAQSRKSSMLAGGGASAMVAAAWELVKALKS